jgi:hypothetical protein
VPTGTLAIGRTAKVKKGVAQLRLSCAAAAPAACAGKLTLSARKRKLGSHAYSLGVGKRRTLKVKLTKTARRLLARASRHRLKVTVALAPSGGRPATRSLTLTSRN